jgi:FecR protein/Putative zinc-finger
MKNFDDVVREIRDEKVDDTVISAAASRVREQLLACGPASAGVHIRSCVDFQALIPQYLAGGLSPARRLLLEDHTLECVKCRRALAEAKAPAGKVVRMDRRPAVWTRPEVRWAIAAMLMIGLGVGTTMVLPNLIPAGGSRATVASVDGALFEVTNGTVVPISAGKTLNEGEQVRTAKAAYAVLKLTDGSTVEMNERAQVSFSRTWRGATIQLDRGNIIVQAAKQKNGRLYVATGDATVSVKGTVFAVSRGMKGSRVSVVEGVVEVAAGGHTETLHRGDQTTTDPNLLQTAVRDEVSWSRNSAHYYALLGEFATLQKKLEALPGPGLRYNTKLAALLPEDTSVFVGIPNIGTTLAEAERLIEDQARDSEVLREWWAKRDQNGFEKSLNELKMLGDYVGDEIVVGVSGDPKTGSKSPMVLAEVKRPGLKAYLESRMSATGEHHPSIAGSRTELMAARPSGNAPVMYADDQMFVMGPSPAAVHQALSGQGGFLRTGFGQRIAQAYQAGASWLIAVNMEQMARGSVSGNREAQKLGISDAQYLVIERKDNGGKTENRAIVSFAHERRGVASWLGAPGPMGSLDFVSPEATAVTSFVIKNPKTMLEDLLAMANGDPKAAQALADFQMKTGLSVETDIAASLGSEITVAVDGPLLPTPSWKVVAEVYNPERLQFSIGKLVDAFNQNAPAEAGKLTLAPQQANGRTYYALSSSKTGITAYYTFVDSYLVAGSSEALIDTAIRNRQAGYTLTKSQTFRSLLPRDGYSNFSGVIFYNASSTLGPILSQLKGAATPAEKKSLDAFVLNSTPTLIYAYGEPDRITLASTGSFFGMSLGALMGAPGHGGMLFPQIFGQAFGHGKMPAMQTQ